MRYMWKTDGIYYFSGVVDCVTIIFIPNLHDRRILMCSTYSNLDFLSIFRIVDGCKLRCYQLAVGRQRVGRVKITHQKIY